MFKKASLVIFIVLVVIQFIPYGREHLNPEVRSEPQWDSPQTKALFKRACMDCHSNETVWPWYSHVAPVSWSVQHHVDEGREHFNVSMWGVQEENEGDEAAEELREGEMPLFGYLMAHPEARLSDDEREKLIRGLVATFGDEERDH